jgi:ketosteroid isomerase-like protein
MADMSFDDFLVLRERAAGAYVRGDGTGVDAIVPHEGAASFHSPGGETVTGGQEVARRYLTDAALFHDNGVSDFQVIQKGHAGDIGFWTGFQVAKAQIGEMPAPADMRLRVTEVFRRVDGAWKLVHRHADVARGQ